MRFKTASGTGDETGPNLEKTIESIRNYSSSCGVECTLIDEHGNELYNTCHNRNGCPFCSSAKKYPGVAEACRNAHLYGSYQAERFGGRYIFFCPLGLVHWASPITHNGSMAGAVLGGPVLMVNAEDSMLEEMLRKNNIGNIGLEDLKKGISKIPVIPPERVRCMSETLFMATMFISDSSRRRYLNDAEITAQQSGISQYIHSIKSAAASRTAASSSDYNNSVDSSLSQPAYPIEKERELLSYISTGDKQNSQKVLNEILGYIFFSNSGDFPTIKARILELLVLLSRAALKGGADDRQIFGINFNYINRINEFDNVEQLTFWLSEIMTRFTDCVFNLKGVKHTDVIYKALDYIKKNHMCRISLDDVAAHVYLSPSYFSSLFKREMNMSFNSYLNRKRIETGKRLLEGADDSVNLLEIAELAGFDDQSYFTKVFKKYTGVSPGKYRESKDKISAII